MRPIFILIVHFYFLNVSGQFTVHYYWESNNIPNYINPQILENYVNTKNNEKVNIVLSPIKYTNPITNEIEGEFTIKLGSIEMDSKNFDQFRTLNEIEIGISNPSEIREQNKSNLVVGKIIHYLNENKINIGCEIGAKVSFKAIEKWGTASCFIPEPTNITKLACAIGLILKDKKYAFGTQKIIENGCVIIVEKTSQGFVEIYLDVKENYPKQKEEILNTLNFLNTVEGLLWIQAKMTGG